jgi:hypothetical protein
VPVDVFHAVADRTLRQGIHKTVRDLVSALGAPTVAILSGTRDLKAPYKWREDNGPSPRPETARRLNFAHELWLALEGATNEHIARSWFRGVNPRLGDMEPVLAIREGTDLAGVRAAARAFIENSE